MHRERQRGGEFVLAESRPGYVRFSMLGASALLRESRGWQIFLAGYGTGLLDLIHCEGRCDIRVSPNGVDVDVDYIYVEPPTAP